MSGESDSVIVDGVICVALSQDAGVLRIDADEDLEVAVDHVIVDGVISPVRVDENGRILIDLGDS